MKLKLFTAVAAAVLLAAAGVVAVAAPGSNAPTSPYESLYTLTSPHGSLDPESAKITLGVKFTAAVPGYVDSVEFYRAVSTATKVDLWSAAGAKLATGTVSGSAVGWVVGRFPAPVHINAGVQFVVSYYTPTRYNSLTHGFDQARTVQDLTVPVGGGVYFYGNGFPTSTYHNEELFVSPWFVPDRSVPSPTTSPPPSSASPSPTTTSASPSPTTTSASPSPTTTSPAPTTTAPTTTAPPPPCSGAPNTPGGADPWGGCWPGPSNTGTSGTLAVHPGDLDINTAGYVLQNTEVDGCITIGANADNVTIRNVLVKSSGCFWLINTHSGATGLQIIDTELDGMDNPVNDAGIGGDNYTATRVNVHNTIDGMKVGYGTTVQDSYIHDMHATSTSHNDGIQSLGTIGLSIEHNTIFDSGDGTAIILLTGVASDMRDISIDRDLLAGGGFTVYGGYSAGQDDVSKVSNISITDNRFSTVYHPASGYYGPLTSVNPPVMHTGNVWADGPNAGQDLD